MKRWRKGDIILYYGAVADIRKGWALCDGNNGTPDLLGVSVIGAGGSFNPGDSGGAVSHTHAFSGDGHTHTYSSQAKSEAGTTTNNAPAQTIVTGTTDGETTRSPYYALCFVMKL
ncbi:hypothetical protein LCGC14_1300880 [marine sediment metagenome]|uniref:Phage tail collar domain-containing protein n=1 Tax=marine sediment metagenome TaxID=412755 RepID=A0A0F9NSM2_9ZZZZ